MLVTVKTNFAGQQEIEPETLTLKGVLLELSKKSTFSFFSGEEIRSDFKVYLNETEYEELPEGIDTRIREGDHLEVNLLIMAGG